MAMLAINNIEVVYDRVILVLKGVSIGVGEGSITTLLGANGAGKTTTLKAISGVLHSERGQVTKGTVELDGVRLDRLPAHDVVRRGVTQVFEGRRVFENLTVEENLVAGAHTRNDFGAVRDGIEPVDEAFPALKERRHPQILPRRQALQAAQALALVSWKLACSYAVSQGVPRRSLGVALVVGTILNLINQGDTLISGQRPDLAKLVLTYVVPYVVSTY